MVKKKHKVKDSLGFWITSLARTLEQDFEGRIKPYDVSRTGYAILSTIQGGDCSTPASVANYLGVDRAAVTRHLDRLEKKKLIKRIKDDEDKRSFSLELTNQGIKILSSLTEESQNTNRKILKKINNQEAEALLDTIKLIIEDDYLPPKKL